MNIDEIDHPTYTSKEFTMRVEALVQYAKRNLRESDWNIIEMSVLNNFSSKEVAAAMNINPINARQRLSRSLKKVRIECKKFWI